jgi:hypothetical protein
MAEPKISFVLLIALSDTGRPGSDLERLHILLRSFTKYFDMSSLGDFFIITRPTDLAPVSKMLESCFHIPTLYILNEQELCPELSEDPDTDHPWPIINKGWHRQQLLKFACHQYVKTPFYMTLDADVIFVRPFSASTLIRSGKSILNIQTEDDYRRVWVPKIAEEEIECRVERDRASARILGMKRSRKFFYGETPVVLSTRVVEKLAAHLAAVSGRNWRQYLLQELPWTELSLYFTFAEASGLLDAYHVLGGFDSVLRMSDSLWLPAESYRDGRNLGSWKIGPSAPDEGIAVVVQSYLGYAVEDVRNKAGTLLNLFAH